MPGADTRAALAEAHALNLPLRRGAGGRQRASPWSRSTTPTWSWSASSSPTTARGDVVVRLYESRGGRAATRLGVGFPVAEAAITDLLERPRHSR